MAENNQNLLGVMQHAPGAMRFYSFFFSNVLGGFCKTSSQDVHDAFELEKYNRKRIVDENSCLTLYQKRECYRQIDYSISLCEQIALSLLRGMNRL